MPTQGYLLFGEVGVLRVCFSAVGPGVVAAPLVLGPVQRPYVNWHRYSLAGSAVCVHYRNTGGRSNPVPGCANVRVL
jgi:hypothetical protein